MINAFYYTHGYLIERVVEKQIVCKIRKIRLDLLRLSKTLDFYNINTKYFTTYCLVVNIEFVNKINKWINSTDFTT